MTKKPLLLCILDGWGIGDATDPSNAIARAKLPNYNRFFQTYPHSQLETSGLSVGLPAGQMGNSEVGHMTIGAGRIIFQDLPRVNNAITDGTLEKNPKLQKLISDLKSSGKACHLMGLLSDGGVHSHINHIIFLADLLVKNGVKVLLHAFLDGRDVAQKSALNYLGLLRDGVCSEMRGEMRDGVCNPVPTFSSGSKDMNGWTGLQTPSSASPSSARIATVVGRYYAMDRDQKWDRVQLATNAIFSADGEKFPDAISAVKNSYEKNITDEFVKPCVIGDYTGVNDGDALLFCNFRADRARQISEKLLHRHAEPVEACEQNTLRQAQGDSNFSHAIALTEYSEKLNNFYEILFPPIEIKNSLPEILSARGLTQLRIAETEKYAHVTFFFSCGQEKEFRGEERILIKSPAVATYDLQPEMSASEVGEKLRAAISSEKFDFILVNYANPDMVGHSGCLAPSIAACEAIDQQLGLLEKIILEKNGTMLISADHGNIECLLDENHLPHTSHTTNPVPLILIGKNFTSVKLANGSLRDIAPTILHLLQIEKPSEMDGKNLINNV